MNDKKIRQILIEYIKAKYFEVRIYQEKSIGSSICDIMVVTDCLIGFEIKSDLDNYSRLDAQVSAYRRFFDENYIVVGESHRKSVSRKIPDNWGIVVVTETGIEIERETLQTRDVYLSREKQLSILWKLELSNLLTKTGLPSYTYKNKEYIIEKIVAQVEDAKIKEHIAYELLHRDYSRFNATDYTIHSFNNVNIEDEDFPSTELVDSLSERDLNEFTLDQWIALYRQAKDVQDTKNAIYSKRIKNRKPHKISWKDIEVSPGVPWVSQEIISDFIAFLIDGTKQKPYHTDYVNYEPITGHWYIPGKKNYYRSYSDRLYHSYGIKDYNALYILEATLNLREIKLYNSDKKLDERRTIAAIEKQEAIINLFKGWIWEDEDRRWEVEEAYNKSFEGYEAKTYDGSKLMFPNMSSDIELYPYQKDAVQKIITEKNTLLAFDVGAGKTYIMIAASMKMREMGISSKNMFVVPNNIVGQWEIIFKEMYPDSKVLSIEPKTFKPEMRQKILRQIRDGDYDGIIIAYSCFSMIPLSGKVIMDQMNIKLFEIEQAVSKMGYKVGTREALKREAESLKRLTSELLMSMNKTTDEIKFDDLEINSLFVDEAHNFKNIPLRINMKNISGINAKGSKKCLNMLHKVQAVQESNNGRGVIFATGTPICNSISDTYAMQMYLQQEELKKLKLDRFNNWIKTFAKIEQLCEIDVDTSKFRFVNKFSGFFNLPELSRLFSNIAIFHSMESEEGMPINEGYNDVVIPKNPYLQDYMLKLSKRTEKIRNGKVERTEDNMLKVSTDGRKAALDLRLVKKKQPYDENSKIYHCVCNVMKIYKEYKECAQVIFCDYSTPKGDKFNVYKELEGHFIKEGVPKKEIAFIHSYHSEASRVNLYEKVNAGKVRILIGSTFKLGIGANIQKRLKAIHHLDVPWRPADVGRILRTFKIKKNVEVTDNGKIII